MANPLSRINAGSSLEPISKMWIRVPRLKAGFHILIELIKVFIRAPLKRDYISDLKKLMYASRRPVN
jgi:hypothetical protein